MDDAKRKIKRGRNEKKKERRKLIEEKWMSHHLEKEVLQN